MIDGLNDAHRDALIDVLSANTNVERIVLFGSRATETYSVTSDIDIALFGDDLSFTDQSRLTEAVVELPYPHKVDLLIYESIRNDKLRAGINNQGVEWFNRSAPQTNDWTETTLGNLVEIKHGFAFKGQFIHDEPDGDVLLTPGNFAIGGGFKTDKFKFYDGEVPGEFVLSEGDLLVTMTDLSKQSDTLGYPASVPRRSDGRRYLHNQRLGKVSVIDQSKIYPRYLYYVMCCPEYRHEVLASATGTTVKHTSPDRIKHFRFMMPPLREQRRIAHILGTLDDKIELNRRMNETLEEMARGIFKDWFVDFGPVRAKMEGRDAYLPEEIWRMFPDRLVESELGEVPEGWGVKNVDDLCVSITSGGTPARKTMEYWHKGTISWFKTGELHDSPVIESEECITSLGLENSSAKMWPIGTVLFALYASPTVGRLAVLAKPGTANQATAGLIPKPEIGTPFLKQALIEARVPLQNIAVGAAQQNINQKILKEHKTVIPDYGLVAKFNVIARPMHHKQSQPFRKPDRSHSGETYCCRNWFRATFR